MFAVAATCSHYGGPLAEGLVIGEEVRCPWHHACFSLRTGEVQRAPALNAIACFDVATRDGKVHVLGKRDLATVRLADVGPTSIVIVGAGAAGNACAEALRRERYAGPIALIGAEETGPVDRPNLSKDYLAGNAPEEWMPLRGEDFYREHEVELVTGARVTAVDIARKRITLEGGGSRPYGALVLATGATPVKPPIAGIDAPHVFVLRTLADSRAVIAKAASSKRAVLIGAGFIGLEVAASLRARGLEVYVVAPEAVPLARVIGGRDRRPREAPPRGARCPLPPGSDPAVDRAGRGRPRKRRARRSGSGRRGRGGESGGVSREGRGPHDRPRDRRRRAPAHERAGCLGHRRRGALARSAHGRVDPRRALGGRRAHGPDRGQEPPRGQRRAATSCPSSGALITT